MYDPNIKKFIRFYDSNLDDLYRFCYIRTHNQELSKDITQQAFMKTWVYVKTKEEEINIKALTYKIAKNLITDWYRKNKEESLDTIMEKTGIEPVSNIKTDQLINTKLTFKIFDELSESDKELIVMRYVNNLKPSEISKILKKDVNATTVAIHRAKNRLKEIINTKYHEKL